MSTSEEKLAAAYAALFLLANHRALRSNLSGSELDSLNKLINLIRPE